MTKHTNITIRDLLEADARSQALLRKLRANPDDLDVWVDTVNVVGKTGKVLSVHKHPRGIAGRDPTQIFIYKAVAKPYNNAVFTYYLHTGSMWGNGTIPWVVLRHSVVAFDIVDDPTRND